MGSFTAVHDPPYEGGFFLAPDPDAEKGRCLMSKKKRKTPPKEGPVYRLTAEEATLLGRPRYNGYAIGHGPHGKAK